MVLRGHGVEEYYLYDPFRLAFDAWVRGENKEGKSELLPVDEVNGFVSPRLGVRFAFVPENPLRIFFPDREPFQTFTELRETAARETEARLRAEQERTQAEQKQREAEAQAERFAARLRELGVNPDTL